MIHHRGIRVYGASSGYIANFGCDDRNSGVPDLDDY